MEELQFYIRVITLFFCILIFTIVIGCGPTQPKEFEPRNDGICEKKCWFRSCSGGKASLGGVQLNFNKTCEAFCIWTNSKDSTKGQCSKSVSLKRAIAVVSKGYFIDCSPCKNQTTIVVRESLISDEQFECHGQGMVSSFTARQEYCTNPHVSNITNSTRNAWITIDMGGYHLLSKINFYPSIRSNDQSNSKNITLKFSDESTKEFMAEKGPTSSISINPVKNTRTIQISGITKDTFVERGSGVGFSRIQLFESLARCCDALDVQARTNTKIDKTIPGKYYYYREYKGNPVYKQAIDNDSNLQPLYLFYHTNRWVIESVVGQIISSKGVQLFGMIRYNGKYICPSTVGNRWTYREDNNGLVKRSGEEKISVSCSTT